MRQPSHDRVRVDCPVCGWVKPLHPHVPMLSCPCGWNETDEEPVVTAEIEVGQLSLDICSLATVST